MPGKRPTKKQRTAYTKALLDTDEFHTAIKDWSKAIDDEMVSVYDEDDHTAVLEYREPPRHESMDEAIKMLRKHTLAFQKALKEQKKNPDVQLKDAVTIMARIVAFTVDDTGGTDTLLTFDYDRKVYVYGDDVIIQYLSEIMGVVTRNNLQSAQMSLLGMKRKLAKYNPPPRYKVAVGNGLYNCLTGELEEYDPRFTVTDHISTNYVPDTYNPNISGGKTFSRMCAELANFDPDRIQLIRQICTAVVTGHSVAPSLFVLVGRGGDGKSTFFQLMVNVIGQKNTAFVNFSELSSPDKMVETVGKKLVLGMDNEVSLYIKNTATLKSIASHEYLTHSRKYHEAISVKFTGTFVQLCNEMPRFAETGTSMLRRIVGFRAENSHTESGDEDRSLERIIEHRDFREHTLHQILNLPYYNDYNDVDKHMVESVLDTEDILAQFVNELRDIGTLSSTNTHIPASHLYAAYRDWMRDTNPTSNPLSFRAFTMKVSKPMGTQGYVVADQQNGVRPTSLERSGTYIPSLFSTYLHGDEMEKARDNNAIAAVFELKHTPQPNVKPVRHPVECSPLEYFDVLGDFSRWLREERPDMYDKLTDFDESIIPDGSIIEEDQMTLQEADPDTQRRVERERAQEKEDREFMNKITPPVDLRNVYKKKSADMLDDYAKWLDVVEESTPQTSTQHIRLISTVEQAGHYAKQVADLEKSMILGALADQATSPNQSVEESIENLREFVDELRDTVA